MNSMYSVKHTPVQSVVRFLAIAACLQSLIAFFFPPSTVKADDRPNFFLFLADNWGWPHACILGDPSAVTPVFDRIAREGVLFNHAFCPVPSCSPTRSCLLTGRTAHQLGPAASLYGVVPNNIEIFTNLLEESGYEIAYSGKGLWGAGFTESGWKGNPFGKEYKSLALFLESRDKTKPFFFLHGNIDTAVGKWPRDGADQQSINPATLTIPPTLPDVPEVRSDLVAYYSSVGRMDTDAGQCVDALEATRLLDKTVVFYASDNGIQLPRGLGNCYDQGSRIPLAIRWGNVLNAGSRLDAFVSVTDFAATFLAIAGVEVPNTMTGVSFLDVMRGETPAVSRDHVFLERERHANVRRGNLSYPIRGIRTADFLYLRNLRPDRWPAGDPIGYYAVGDFGDVDESLSKRYLIENRDSEVIKPFFELSFAKRPKEELYDLRNDPDQLKNVADQKRYDMIRVELGNRVDRWMRDTSDPRLDESYDAWDEYPYLGQRVIDEQGKPIKKKSTVQE
jgi:N-sulfoglucosamine sulfohydrolase